jgi:purine-nucleoside/S-methyl-5'-thioadenosine phosphorylase / adenosine deaminase
MQFPFEKFQALNVLAMCRHIFTRRIPGIHVSHDKAEALKRLESAHLEIRNAIGIGDWPLLTAQQIHGDKIACVNAMVETDREFSGCDGIITNQRGVTLGIYVADCCAVYLVDRKQRAAALIHSGKKGTNLRIVSKAIAQMHEKFSIEPQDLIAQLSPCIRPPHYEVDFAADIIRQCQTAGLNEIHDSGICTACNLDAYYSYRAEKGRTGRMLALLALANS